VKLAKINYNNPRTNLRTSQLACKPNHYSACLSVVFGFLWEPSHGQALDALWGYFSQSCLYGPAMVLHKGCRGVGVTTGCPILPLDLFME
jgi:hypothetical protein